MILLGAGLLLVAILFWYSTRSKIPATFDAYGGTFGSYPGLRPQDKI